MQNVIELVQFLNELDKLKSVYRRSFLINQSRRENSAEHSWQLALALLTIQGHIEPEVDFAKMLKMALVHDICEIGAGDVSVFSPERDSKTAQEKAYLEQLVTPSIPLTGEILALWQEYEQQESAESQWVKVFDRFLPFLLNMGAKGETWRELSITKTQVLTIALPIQDKAPALYAYLESEVERAVESGWLINK